MEQHTENGQRQYIADCKDKNNNDPNKFQHNTKGSQKESRPDNFEKWVHGCFLLSQKMGLSSRIDPFSLYYYCFADNGLSESAHPSTTRTPMGAAFSLN